MKRKPIEHKIDEKGCWICTSHSLCKGGYPRTLFKGKKIRVHVISLEQRLGRKIKKGYQANHTCNNKLCINPEHLYEGTQEQNIQDAMESGSFSKGENHVSAKLSDQEIKEIRKSGLSRKELSRMYKITTTHISRIIRRKSREGI